MEFNTRREALRYILANHSNATIEVDGTDPEAPLVVTRGKREVMRVVCMEGAWVMTVGHLESILKSFSPTALDIALIGVA